MGKRQIKIEPEELKDYIHQDALCTLQLVLKNRRTIKLKKTFIRNDQVCGKDLRRKTICLDQTAVFEAWAEKEESD